MLDNRAPTIKKKKEGRDAARTPRLHHLPSDERRDRASNTFGLDRSMNSYFLVCDLTGRAASDLVWGEAIRIMFEIPFWKVGLGGGGGDTYGGKGVSFIKMVSGSIRFRGASSQASGPRNPSN